AGSLERRGTMRSWLTRALWALALGLGVMAGLARGEDLPRPLPGPPAVPPAVPYGGVVVPPTGVLIVPPSPHPSGYTPGAYPASEVPPDVGPVPTPNGPRRFLVWRSPPC